MEKINLAPVLGEASIAEHLEFDALHVAGQLTGNSYKDDPETETIGLALHMRSVSRKRAALTASDDTDLSTALDRYIRIISEEGFREVLRIPFDGRGVGEGNKETFFVFWHDSGVLLNFDTFGGDRVNSGHLTCNWRGLSGRWPRSFTGHQKEGGIFVGHIDCREALRFRLRELREGGEFLCPWVECPWLWLLHYADTEIDGYDYRAINQERLAMLPEDIRAAIPKAQP